MVKIGFLSVPVEEVAIVQGEATPPRVELQFEFAGRALGGGYIDNPKLRMAHVLVW